MCKENINRFKSLIRKFEKNGKINVNLFFRWHIEPFSDIDDKHVSNKVQLLQNRVHQIERTLARRDTRDRLFYTCIIGYFLMQALFSVRRSMLN
jgi:hypothetical protein